MTLCASMTHAFNPTSSITLIVAGVETEISMNDIENIETRNDVPQTTNAVTQQASTPIQQTAPSPQPSYNNTVSVTTTEENLGIGRKYDHGHRGLDFSFNGSLQVGQGGVVIGGGDIALGKRFSRAFQWDFLGFGVIGNDYSVYLVYGQNMKVLFPVTSSGIAPNFAFRYAFNQDLRRDYHSLLFAFLPGIQIPLSQRVDLNVNVGYALSVNVGDGSGTGHSFMATLGLGLHKPWKRKK